MKTRDLRRRLPQTPKQRSKIPAILISMSGFIAIGSIILFVDPHTTGIIPIFFILIFITSMFLVALLTQNTFRGLIYASAVSLFLLLRYFGVGNILNFILIIGIVTSIEIFKLSK